jgi:hypothetical protein
MSKVGAAENIFGRIPPCSMGLCESEGAGGCPVCTNLMTLPGMGYRFVVPNDSVAHAPAAAGLPIYRDRQFLIF